MNKKKLSLLCTKKALKSASLRALAQGLSTSLGYKVWRTTKTNSKKVQPQYGFGVNKLEQYLWFKENDIPAIDFTQEQHIAKDWLAKGKTVFARHLLNASCGKGIQVVAPEQPLPVAPVYTLYKKKKREFRVHVYKGVVINVTEKKRRKGFEGERDTKIRNLANGYVFVQQVEDEPNGLRELALMAAQVSPSDFRGVDIGYNEKANELFVIEVNSAPGIQGTNLTKYMEGVLQNV